MIRGWDATEKSVSWVRFPGASFSLSFTKTNKGKGETNMHKHEKLTKREKTIIGAAVVTTCIAGYFGYKYFSGIKLEELLVKDNKYLKDSVDTLMAAASEGVFEEAIGTVNHKITYRVDKEKYLIEYLKEHPTHTDAQKGLERVTAELTNLYARRAKFEAAQELYVIKNDI